ncbi:MAG TPA: hypothetical protein PKB03_02300 [Baekduia sp.]|nr:hypothetical protein [Baekduia sp.]
MNEQPLPLHRGASRFASTAATTTAIGAIACGVCCVLPFALPAVVLAGTGGIIAWFGQAFWGALYSAGALVTIAWAWVAVSSIRSRRRPAPSTMRAMLVATVALGVALIWPTLEPHIPRALRG